MRLRLVTVAILLAVASRGHGRPTDPDPLDNNSSQEVVAGNLGTASRSGNSESRYMMTMRRRAALTSSPSDRRRDISITSVKYGSGSFKSNWQGRSLLPGSSFDTGVKNYLPLGALSPSVTPRRNGSLKQTNQRNRQSVGRSPSAHYPMVIPFISSFQSTTTPITVSYPVYRKSEDLIKNLPLHKEHKLSSPQISTPIPIPVLISQESDVVTATSIPRGERKMERKNLIKLNSQKLKPGYKVQRNSTTIMVKPQISNVLLKNWPNEALQSVQDLFNYEKYTSFIDENMEDRKKLNNEDSKVPNRREPAIKSPIVQPPVHWSKVPIVEVTPSANDRIDVDSSLQIDEFLGDLDDNANSKQHQASSQIAQNTIVHILNANSRKPNITVAKPENVNNNNKTKIGSTRPPQNVHIMFMTDKGASDTGKNSTELPPIGTDADCPTIMINSITQINNTIQSKEGCTDLNIVINSHILNTNIFKPTVNSLPISSSNSQASKDPYSSAVSSSSNNYQNNELTNSYQNNYYNNGYKEPTSQIQSDDVETPESIEPTPEISTFEVFQGTHINIEGNNQPENNVQTNVENYDTGVSGSDEPAGNDADGSPMSDSETANDVMGTNPEVQSPGNDIPAEGGSAANGDSSPASIASDSVAEASQSSASLGEAGDIGTAQANGAPGEITLPSLPNIPNIPNVPGTLSNVASNVGNGNTGTSSGQTSLASDDDDDDDEEDFFDALSPVGMLDSMTTVFNSFSILNPINYGIFGMAVAPFLAFAAGIVGVTAFLFPWVFPGSLSLARAWDSNHNRVTVKFNPHLRDIVHSSIHKYRLINEWKGRRRKRKRKK